MPSQAPRSHAPLAPVADASGMGMPPEADQERYRADADAVRAVLGGQRERFAELVERYQAAVYSVALGYLRDAHRAEDLAQEIFTAAFINLDQLREPERFFPWLLQCARNRTSREVQRAAARPEQPLYAVLEPIAPGADQDLARAAAVFALVEQLPEPYRETLLLKYRQDLTCKEIAARERVPIGTITSRLTRALAILRTALGEEP